MHENSGIYKITNMSNGKMYIGSSKNLTKRKREHFWSLRKGNHINSYLQNAWNKYGELFFEFKIIENVKNEEELLKKEQVYMDSFKSCNRFIGYNINEYASGGGLKGENHPNYGKSMSEEQKEKIRNTLMGHEVSSETKYKMSKGRTGKCCGEKNYLFGKKRTEKQRNEHSKKMKGRYIGSSNPSSRTIVQMSLDGNFIKKYETMKDACAEVNVFSSNICKCCKGEYKKTGGYKWMYYDDYINML